MKIFPILIISVFCLAACSKIKPKGEVINKDLKLQNFQNLRAEGNYRLIFVPSKSSFLNVETYQNISDNLDIEVKNGTLSLSEKRPTGFVDFYVITVFSRQAPNNISLKDSVEFNVSGRISAKNLTVEQAGYSKFIGAVQADKFVHSLSGNSRASILGRVQRLTLNSTDSANIISPYLQTSVLNIKANKATYTEISVEDTLRGNIDGKARFLYYGNPVRAFKIGSDATVNSKNSK